MASADVFVVEPVAPVGAMLVQAACLVDPSLPIVFTRPGVAAEC